MKRFFLAITLLVFCFSVAIYGFVSLEKSCGKLIGELDCAASLIVSGNTEEAENALKKIDESWKRERLSFNIFLDHTTLDTLDSSLPALCEILNSGDEEQAFEEIQKNIAVLEDIVEEQRISIGNIL